jgi:hypothetical protein
MPQRFSLTQGVHLETDKPSAKSLSVRQPTPFATKPYQSVQHPGGPDRRGNVPIKKVRDIYIPHLHIDTQNVKARNFR